MDWDCLLFYQFVIVCSWNRHLLWLFLQKILESVLIALWRKRLVDLHRLEHRCWQVQFAVDPQVQDLLNIMYLPFLSQICFSTLHVIFEFIRIKVPLLWFVPVTKNNFTAPFRSPKIFSHYFELSLVERQKGNSVGAAIWRQYGVSILCLAL